VNIGIRLVWTASSLTALLISGCGILSWREVYCANQPHGSAQVCVEEICGLADCSVRIVVKRGWTKTQIPLARGCVIDFVQAAWVGSTVGVFVDGGTCQQVRAAYDVDAKRAVPFQTAADAIRSVIIQDYNVSPDELRAEGGDALKWATYPGDGQPRRSKDEFGKRYPH